MPEGGSTLRLPLVLAALLLARPIPGAAAGSLPAAEPARCGAGGLLLPGTVTCVRLGGLVRAEAGVASRAAGPPQPGASDGGRRRAASALRAQGRVDLDARIPTASGPVRAYLSVGTGVPSRR